MIRARKKLETRDLVAYRDGVLASRYLVSYKNDGIHEQAL